MHEVYNQYYNQDDYLLDEIQRALGSNVSIHVIIRIRGRTKKNKFAYLQGYYHKEEEEFVNFLEDIGYASMTKKMRTMLNCILSAIEWTMGNDRPIDGILFGSRQPWQKKLFVLKDHLKNNCTPQYMRAERYFRIYPKKIRKNVVCKETMFNESVSFSNVPSIFEIFPMGYFFSNTFFDRG